MRRKITNLAQELGWRSGLEEKVGKDLHDRNVAFSFEAHVIPYLFPESARRYTPDFVLPNGIIVETKGRFVTADRKKHLLIQWQHPDLDIRFLFSRANNRISKHSKTTYARWCEDHEFLYAEGASIPEAWVREAGSPRSIAAIEALLKGPPRNAK